jgi:hypothetical protein
MDPSTGLGGDWVLLGGALVAFLLDPERATEDIDLVPLRPDAASRHGLLLAAERAGLAIEAVNSAADFFLYRIPGWDSALEPLLERPGLRVFRPSPPLFLRLKVDRLSERDLLDCELAVRASGAGVDWAPVRARLDELDGLPATPELRGRREALRTALGGG